MKNIALIRAAGSYWLIACLLFLVHSGAMAQTVDKKIPGKRAAILIVSLKSQFPIQQAIGLEVMMEPKLSCGSRPGIRQHNIPASIRSLSTGNVSSSFQFRKISITPDVYFKNQIHKAAMSLFRKSTCLIAGVLIFWCDVGYSQAEISGKWLSPDGDRKIEIYENNGSYSGKIIWLKSNTGKVRVGDIVMKNIIYKNDHWEGSAYIPARDRDLPVSISMPGDDELEMTGKVGMISRTKRWKRCK